jgi:dTMP kinase
MVHPSRPPRSRGVLIAFEGIDGTGKSTQVARLATRLRAEGRAVVQTSEPTQGEWGRKIRALAREGREGVAREDELDWFLRDRMEHVEQTIRPALHAGKIVVTDRYYFSTMAYQGALGLDPRRIQEMNEALFPRPDLVILLVASPEVGLSRIARHRKGLRDVGFEQSDYLHRVASLFESFRDPAIRAVDAAKRPDEVEERVWAAVDPFLCRPAAP